MLRVPPGHPVPVVEPGWVVAALLLAPGAVLAYGELHRQVLRRSGAGPSALAVQAVTVAGNAMSATLPVGGSTSAVVWSARALTRRGVALPTATVTVLVAAAVSSAVLGCLVPVLLTLTGVLPTTVGTALTAVAVALGVAAFRVARSRRLLTRAVTWLLRATRRVRRGTDTGADAARAARWASVADTVPGGRDVALLGVTAVVMYGFDAAALVAAAHAVPPPPPVGALALGWVAAQVGMVLQLTPGGVGLAEAGLGGTLLAVGTPAPQVAVVVIVYRVADWLVPAVLGWLVYLLLDRIAPPAVRDLPRRSG